MCNLIWCSLFSIYPRKFTVYTRKKYIKAFSISWIFKWSTPISVLPQVVHIKDARSYISLFTRKDETSVKHIIAKIIYLDWNICVGLLAQCITFNELRIDTILPSIDSFVLSFFPSEFSSFIRTIFVSSFVYHIHFHTAIGSRRYENVCKSDADSELPAATKGKEKSDVLK